MEEFLKILKQIRKEVKEAYKGYRVSVRQERGGYISAIRISIEDENGNEIKDISKASEIVKKYQDPGDTDIMTDYFDYNFYYTINGRL